MTKLCECGCGQPTAPCKVTDPSRGLVKGQPNRFINSHNKAGFRHGHSKRKQMSPEYHCWRGMVYRCSPKNKTDYSNYAGRGISVCERWRGKGGFENFLADMGQRPAGMSLDRWPNQNGNYEPGNCRWATAKEQANNRRKRKTGYRRLTKAARMRLEVSALATATAPQEIAVTV